MVKFGLNISFRIGHRTRPEGESRDATEDSEELTLNKYHHTRLTRSFTHPPLKKRITLTTHQNPLPRQPHIKS
jgi:hypothetical protein